MKTFVNHLRREIMSLKSPHELGISYGEVNNTINLFKIKGEDEVTNFVGLSKEEKLEVLNSMNFAEVGASGYELDYILVDNNEENISKISKLVNNHEQVIQDWGSDEYYIDITRLAFENCQADYFDGKKFTFLG